MENYKNLGHSNIYSTLEKLISSIKFLKQYYLNDVKIISTRIKELIEQVKIHSRKKLKKLLLDDNEKLKLKIEFYN